MNTYSYVQIYNNRNDTMDNKLSFETMPDSELIFELADLFKVFGDSTRLRIMYALSDGELPVMEIAEGLKMEQSTTLFSSRFFSLTYIGQGRASPKPLR